MKLSWEPSMVCLSRIWSDHGLVTTLFFDLLTCISIHSVHLCLQMHKNCKFGIKKIYLEGLWILCSQITNFWWERLMHAQTVRQPENILPPVMCRGMKVVQFLTHSVVYLYCNSSVVELHWCVCTHLAAVDWSWHLLRICGSETKGNYLKKWLNANWRQLS